MKIISQATQFLDSVVSTQFVYRFNNDKVLTDFPELTEQLTCFNALTTNAFKKYFEQLFFTSLPLKEPQEAYTQVYGRLHHRRQWCFIKQEYLLLPADHNKWRVLITKANGSGILGEALSSPVIIAPEQAFTQSFISVGSYDTQQEAEHALKYIKSKFARLALGILKTTQDTVQEKWGFVPLPDFSNTSDIDWSKSIPEIDQQLYQKYGLTEAEIRFIESEVKAMP